MISLTQFNPDEFQAILKLFDQKTSFDTDELASFYLVFCSDKGVDTDEYAEFLSRIAEFGETILIGSNKSVGRFNKINNQLFEIHTSYPIPVIRELKSALDYLKVSNPHISPYILFPVSYGKIKTLSI